MTNKPLGIIALLAAFGIVLGLQPPAYAIDKCKVKIDKKTGVIRVDAKGVDGPLTWGKKSGEVTSTFFNAGACIAGANAKKCELADPTTLASKTPPAGCTVYLSDGGTPCSAWISGCSPAPREGAALLWKDANGTTVGIAEENGSRAVITSGSPFFYVGMRQDGTAFEPVGQVVFTSSDCSGPALAYGDSGLLKAIQYLGPGVPSYYATGAGTSMTYSSYLATSMQYVNQGACTTIVGAGATYVAPFSCCSPGSYGPDLISPAAAVDLSGYVTPLHLEAQ